MGWLLAGQVWAQDRLILGVVPQQSPLKLYQNWQPVAAHLSGVTGREVVFETEKSIAEFETQLAKGRYDMAYMNPYHYVVAHQQQGYLARFRREGDIRGILVSTHSTFEPQKLLARPVLFPSPNAFAATLVIKYEMLENFDLAIEAKGLVRYVNSHDSVYKGVARGVGDYGGGVERTFRAFDADEDKGKLQVVYRTAPYPSHPIAFHPRLTPATASQLTQAWQTLPQKVMDPLGFARLMPVEDDDYAPIRALRARLSVKPVSEGK
ncbi:phosphate/phosphite/phosphonate ABC transporter substrate-binding protein [Hydrogenovibrio halophilus]|uniref:phosphate/phosphite/phosphonate ABC transporter substrate-binding protein n=1 Tax=Hydrogenovibrio halophilus TaxID=373391 RepID=UPI000371206D|nr:phosphate/phosphite/phosphonate ABC transporter substrate-binding protein [Hydrogenovibrio halophilus]